MGYHQRDLNLISVFLEVYRLRSITLAAESLQLTQPAVSSALKRFSKQLGNALFVREGRGIAPTHIAVQLATELSPLLEAVEQSLSNVEQFDHQKPRTFTVYVTEPMLYLLQPKFSNHKVGNCSIDIKLAPRAHEDVLKHLSLQKVDLAIDSYIKPNQTYCSEPFHQDPMVVICAKQHPRLSDNINFQQFLQETHIGGATRRDGLRILEYLSDADVHHRDIVCDCDSALSIMLLVSESDSISVINQSLAQKYRQQFQLNILPLPFHARPIEHFLLYHQRSRHSLAQQWLIAELKKAL